MRRRAGILIMILAAWLPACQTLGPETVRVGRSKYNEAIHETDKQQILQNLVRLRYKDFPYFIEVSTVVAAPLFEVFGEGSARFGNILDAYEIGGGLRYAEAPIIVYAPLGGENFTRRLLQPIDFATISLLGNAGWNTERLMRLCVQSINGVQNAESAAGPTPAAAPKHDVFNRIIATLEDLHAEGLERTGRPEGADGTSQLHSLTIDASVKQRPDVRQLLADLKLDPDVETYKVVNALRGGGDTIAVVMRPLLSVMYFMCQAVEVPANDVGDGVVTITRDESGEPFDWQQVMQGMIRIRSSLIEPLDTFVSVRYGGSYFYIARDDVESKETFTLLMLLFTLQAGEKPTTSPLLSLPIGGL